MKIAVARRSATDNRYRGGDLFAWCPRADGSAYVIIADASAKGRAGIVDAEMLWGSFLGFSMNELEPAAIAAQLNALRFAGQDDDGRTAFASAFIGKITPRRDELVYASAGHEPALLFRGCAHTHLEPTGPILGVIPGATYRNAKVHFRSTDILLLATDGVTEARHRSNPDVQFGTAGLVRSVDAIPTWRAGEIPDRVMCASEAFCDNDRRDDATVAVLSSQTGEYVIPSPAYA